MSEPVSNSDPESVPVSESKLEFEIESVLESDSDPEFVPVSKSKPDSDPESVSEFKVPVYYDIIS